MAHRGPVARYPMILARLDAFLDDPSIETWTGAYLIVIGGGLNTYWRCVAAVDPRFPRALATVGVWTVFPDELVARRALRYAAAIARGAHRH